MTATFTGSGKSSGMSQQHVRINANIQQLYDDTCLKLLLCITCDKLVCYVQTLILVYVDVQNPR